MIDHGQSLAIIEGMAGRHVTCVGDVMLDRYVHGAVDRISPEAPVPVLRVERETVMPGGAGNVARNLSALGARVSLVGVVGDDEAASTLRAMTRVGDVIDGALLTDPLRKTTLKTRFLSGNQQILRADLEDTAPLSASLAGSALTETVAAMTDTQVVILSDYAKGVFTGNLAAEIIAAAHARSLPVIVDPKGTATDRYRSADVITPNRRELSIALGETVEAGDEISAARRLIAKYSFGAILVTLGRDGMILVPADDDAMTIPARTREVFDVSGAGDTVVATLGASLAAGASLLEAANLANIAAGIVVGKAGTSVAYPEEIRRSILAAADVTGGSDKILPLEEACDRISLWRRTCPSIGFTNGCFDLIHPGHLSLIQQARAACDRLVVGLNSDPSVARLKGPTRPIQNETARALILASLAAVDLVVIFDEDTPIRLIEAIRPDVLVKGADYELERVVGHDVVAGYGGRVLLARLETGYSTTQTVQRVSQTANSSPPSTTR